MRNNVLGYEAYLNEKDYDSTSNHISPQTANRMNILRQKIQSRGGKVLNIAS